MKKVNSRKSEELQKKHNSQKMLLPKIIPIQAINFLILSVTKMKISISLLTILETISISKIKMSKKMLKSCLMLWKIFKESMMKERVFSLLLTKMNKHYALLKNMMSKRNLKLRKLTKCRKNGKIYSKYPKLQKRTLVAQSNKKVTKLKKKSKSLKINSKSTCKLSKKKHSINTKQALKTPKRDLQKSKPMSKSSPKPSKIMNTTAKCLTSQKKSQDAKRILMPSEQKQLQFNSYGNTSKNVISDFKITRDTNGRQSIQMRWRMKLRS